MLFQKEETYFGSCVMKQQGCRFPAEIVSGWFNAKPFQVPDAVHAIGAGMGEER